MMTFRHFELFKYYYIVKNKRHSPAVLPLLCHLTLASTVPSNVNTAEDPLFPIKTTVCETNSVQRVATVLSLRWSLMLVLRGKTENPPKFSLKSKNTLHVLVCISHALSNRCARERPNGPSSWLPARARDISLVEVCDTARFGIDPIPSKYRASIADTDTNTDTF